MGGELTWKPVRPFLMVLPASLPACDIVADLCGFVLQVLSLLVGLVPFLGLMR